MAAAVASTSPVSDSVTGTSSCCSCCCCCCWRDPCAAGSSNRSKQDMTIALPLGSCSMCCNSAHQASCKGEIPARLPPCAPSNCSCWFCCAAAAAPAPAAASAAPSPQTSPSSCCSTLTCCRVVAAGSRVVMNQDTAESTVTRSEGLACAAPPQFARIRFPDYGLGVVQGLALKFGI